MEDFVSSVRLVSKRMMRGLLRAMLLIALLPFHWAHAVRPYSDSSADQQKGNSKGWPCERKIDPSYIEVTEGSGGQILMFDPSEAADSMFLMESRLKGNEETVFRASGDLSGEKEFEIMVDPSIESITYSCFVQCMKGIQIYGADSKEILGLESGLKDHRYISGRVTMVEAPAFGKWKIRISGSGYFSVLAEAKTDLSLSLEFVEIGGRPGHEGYFPLQRPLKSQAEEMLSVHLDGMVKSARFQMLHRDGTILQEFQLPVSSSEPDSTDYLGKVRIPEQPFRILVQGEDQQGAAFERYSGPLFRAQ